MNAFTKVLFRISLAVALIILSYGAGSVWGNSLKAAEGADDSLPPTATPGLVPSTDDSTATAPLPAGALGTDNPNFMPPPQTQVYSPLTPSAIAPLQYLTIAGAGFKGRSSSLTYTYYTTGCIYNVPADFVVANIQLPNNSVMKQIKLFYRDTNAAANAYGYLTYYSPGQASVDAVYVSSSSTSGFGIATSKEITVTVDNSTYSYFFLSNTGTAETSVQVCGMQVAYLPPLNQLLFLPTVKR